MVVTVPMLVLLSLVAFHSGMHIKSSLYVPAFFAVNFFLIYWPGEDSVTAVPATNLVEPSNDNLKYG